MPFKKIKNSQSDIASQLGISRVAVHKWMSGKCLPTTTHLLALAKILRLSMEDTIIYLNDHNKEQDFIAKLANYKKPH